MDLCPLSDISIRYSSHWISGISSLIGCIIQLNTGIYAPFNNKNTTSQYKALYTMKIHGSENSKEIVLCHNRAAKVSSVAEL